MHEVHDTHLTDEPIAPEHQARHIKDRRRPGRIREVNPALIPLLRNAGDAVIVDDLIPMPGVIEAAPLGIRHLLASLTVWPWALLGAGISTAAVVWFVAAHGSWIALGVRNLLSFLYGIGVLM